MYCEKLKSIVKQIESIKLNINNEFIARFDKCIKDNTTERERLKLNPIKIANEMGISQELVMKFFNIGKKVELFKAIAFYSCPCGEYFEIFNFDKTECVNGCEADIINNKDRVFIYFELLEEVDECDLDIGEIYQMDYISSDDLGNFRSSYDEYEKVIGEEDAKNLLNNVVNNNELKEISIIHISDLHFGSDYNTGMDNKAGLMNIRNMSPDIFESFSKKVTELNASYLIISGDITSKNEEKGFIEFKDKISKLGIGSDKIYIVPGNHECDRNRESEDGQFALFASYTRGFKTIYSDEAYILDENNKIFIYGFNSVNFKKENEKELFYIKNEEFDKLDYICKQLNQQKEDFDSYTKIAVIHNNLIPHPNIEIKEYAEVLNLFLIKYKLVKLGFKLVCSGHKHEELIEKHTVYSDENESEIVLASAPSLCGSVFNGKNGFQIIKILNTSENKASKFIINKYETNILNDFKFKGKTEINLNN
ncbi:metallophosphoesterase [Clostridium sp. DL-VIII]|uniref:metallophosphoesterase family protein n=1 Tax=Clostridium sp. DL-VIII TaxID=641107 RepID=UPI00023AF4DD|nr:metallophosphoesterase [Clostridium sp. DL-VIII]EHI97265.1 metallophosphoesterase [Clostridium sp. DL-VIII]